MREAYRACSRPSRKSNGKQRARARAHGREINSRERKIESAPPCRPRAINTNGGNQIWQIRDELLLSDVPRLIMERVFFNGNPI